MSFMKWFNGDMVPAAKYDYLKSKYEELKIEFRRYREKSEIRERNNKRLITDLRSQTEAQNKMWVVALPYIISGQPMKNNDKVKIQNLAKENGLYSPI